WGWKLLLRLFILLIGYQVIILIVSFFFGQFRFFWNYEKKILRWMGVMKKPKAGGGSWESGASKPESGVGSRESNTNSIY
ncbi:MAG: DUF6787 family protein, partial [Chitinophagaceae bacterium]